MSDWNASIIEEFRANGGRVGVTIQFDEFQRASEHPTGLINGLDG